MKIFTATIRLDEGQERVMSESATFFGMEVQSFLNAALQSGLAHAEDVAMRDTVDPEEHDGRPGERS